MKFTIETLIQILVLAASIGLMYGKLSSSMESVQTDRKLDLARIEKIEIILEHNKKDIIELEKKHIEITSDLKYIRETLKSISEKIK